MYSPRHLFNLVFKWMSLKSSSEDLHRLEIVGLLDLGLPFLAHGLAQLLPLGRRLERVLDITVLLGRQVDRLLRQRYLGCEGRQIARLQYLLFQQALALGG
jgi:hypothetical protein